jgi:hypothetical protein
MPLIAPSEKAPDRFGDSVVAWFAEMVMALDRRDIDTAAEAKRQLTRLGWRVQYCQTKADRQGDAR